MSKDKYTSIFLKPNAGYCLFINNHFLQMVLILLIEQNEIIPSHSDPQQISNNHPSPGTMYQELGATVSKYLKKAIGNAPILPKDPMFQDDFEHILDVLGLDNPATMQRKY